MSKKGSTPVRSSSKPGASVDNLIDHNLLARARAMIDATKGNESGRGACASPLKQGSPVQVVDETYVSPYAYGSPKRHDQKPDAEESVGYNQGEDPNWKILPGTVACLRGSNLVTTKHDLRGYLRGPKGGMNSRVDRVRIDGVEYEIQQQGGEWTERNFQLARTSRARPSSQQQSNGQSVASELSTGSDSYVRSGSSSSNNKDSSSSSSSSSSSKDEDKDSMKDSNNHRKN